MKEGLRQHDHDTSILDGNSFATLQTEASRTTLELPKDPKKSKTAQLMGVTEKLWKSAKYPRETRDAMKRLTNALTAIIIVSTANHGLRKTADLCSTLDAGNEKLISPR